MTHPRIIAELGINHNGSEETARTLIDAAANAGVWGIKFQYRNLTNTYADDSRQIGDEILQREIVRNYIAPEKILKLCQHAQKLGVKPGISFFTPEDIEDFGPDVDIFEFFKIPSVEFTNDALINRIEALGKIGIISTGAYTETVIAKTLKNLNRECWVPLHCVSNYPVAITSPKLGYIKHMERLWNAPVGYSSHDDHWEACILAMQLGACIIERHITLDKTADGLDHSSSSTPDEFERLALFAKNLELMVAGDGPRIPNQGELLNLQNLGRSYYTSSEIPEGTLVTTDKLQLRSPRTGLGQEEIRNFLGSPAVRRLKIGEVVDKSVFEQPLPPDDEVVHFARTNKLSLPVRFHDLDDIEGRFPIGRFEFHLSFGDIDGVTNVTSLNHNNRYSIHLPDYVSSTQLMDPFSTNETQRRASHHIIEKTAEFANVLQDLTGAEVPIVGSFSVVHSGLEEFYREHSELAASYRARGVSILPQWLPPVAWYFGGAVRLKAMNNVADIQQIKARDLPICMDVCHLCMGDKIFDFSAVDVVKDLAPQTRHVHLADAGGYDGEGLPFGKGDPENMDAIASAMTFDCVKVVEVWQGHLHGGAGFAKALIDLRELFNGHE
jgi:sialic acid synthase SpsE/sugar phosphate isomerase/epimerase